MPACGTRLTVRQVVASHFKTAGDQGLDPRPVHGPVQRERPGDGFDVAPRLALALTLHQNDNIDRQQRYSNAKETGLVAVGSEKNV
jgi:hypothetical protein